MLCRREKTGRRKEEGNRRYPLQYQENPSRILGRIHDGEKVREQGGGKARYYELRRRSQKILRKGAYARGGVWKKKSKMRSLEIQREGKGFLS